MGILVSLFRGTAPEKVTAPENSTSNNTKLLKHNSLSSGAPATGPLATRATNNNLRSGIFGEQSQRSPAETASLQADLDKKEKELTLLQSKQPMNSTNSSRLTTLQADIETIKNKLKTPDPKLGGRSRKIKLKLKRKKRAKSLRR